MKQDVKLYWPQHKVFFIATLVLFPDKLDGHEVNQWFYRPYFAGDDPTFIEIELEDYRKAGYLKYEKAGALYKITEVHSKKAKKDLLQYLKQWQRNELLTLSAGKAPDPERQKELLLAAIVLDYPDHKSKLRITLENIYGKPGSYAYKPPFWELVLAYQLLDKKIKITYMDYDRRDDGLYPDNGQPTIDCKIADNELAALVELKPVPAQQPLPTVPESVVISMNTDGTVYAELAENKRLIKKLRRDSAPYNFMNYMLGHQKQDITRGVIQTDVDGCATKENMTELAKACGFTKELLPLKAEYFGGTTKIKVHFRATAKLTPNQVELLIQRQIV